MNKKALHYILIFLILTQGLLIVRTFGVNLFVADEWDGVTTIFRYFSNTLDFNYLISQHNEHRIFFPRLIIVGFGLLSNVNVIWLMYASQFLLIVTALFLYSELSTELLDGRREKLVYSLPIFFLPFFSTRNADNFLSGFQIVFVLVFCTSVLSFVFLNKFRRSNNYLFFIFAIILAIVSSFSSLQGLFVWFIGILFLVLNYFASENVKLKHLIIWFTFAVLCFIFYFVGYQQSTNHSTILFALTNPLLPIVTFLSYLGVFAKYEVACCVSVFQLVLLGYILYSYRKAKLKSLANLSLPLTLISYGLIFGLSIAVGRASFMNGNTSRYFLFLCPFLIGVMFLLEKLRNRSRFNMALRNAYLLFIVGWFLFTQAKDFTYLSENALLKRNLRSKIISGSISDEELLILYPDVAFIKSQTEQLKKYKINVFSEE